MRLFDKLFKKNKDEDLTTGQAVIFRYAVSEEFGSEAEHENAYSIEDTANEALTRGGIGDVDGHEFGEGEAVFYSYGPNADKIYEALEPYLRQLDVKPIHVTVRYGEPDEPGVRTKEVVLD